MLAEVDFRYLSWSLGWQCLAMEQPNEALLSCFLLVALGIEGLVYLSLMKLLPLGKGGCDIIWGLPFFGLIVLALAIPDFSTALKAKSELKAG